jgi:putative peptidoglycan lipid II flippase
VRERVFAHYFGSSDFADAWRAGLRLPNVVQNLLGEGTLSASLVPIYAEMLEQGRKEDARRFAGAMLGILCVVASALALLGCALAPAIVALFFSRWDASKQALTVLVVRVLFPMTGVLVLSAWALGILNSHRRFFVSYVAPVFWNLAMVVAMVAGVTYFGLPPQSRDLVVALAWGALVGGVLQLGWQLPFLLRSLGGVRLSLGRGVSGVREAVTSFVPVVAARGVVNLSGWVDLVLAGWLRTGAVALMGYAQTFYLLPISLFGMSVAASELPELSRMRGEAEQMLATRVAAALRRVAYFIVPAAVGYLFLGDVIVAALYETGEFTAAETLATWAVLSAYTLGLPASGSSRVLTSAFYALRDTETPARAAYLRVVLAAALGVALMLPADRLGFEALRLGAAGLALGSTAGAWAELLVLRRALKRRIGPHGAGAAVLVRLALAAALAGASGVAIQLALPPAPPLVTALGTLIPFGVVYLAVAALLGQGGLRRRAAGA